MYGVMRAVLLRKRPAVILLCSELEKEQLFVCCDHIPGLFRATGAFQVFLFTCQDWSSWRKRDVSANPGVLMGISRKNRALGPGNSARATKHSFSTMPFPKLVLGKLLILASQILVLVGKRAKLSISGVWLLTLRENDISDLIFAFNYSPGWVVKLKYTRTSLVVQWLRLDPQYMGPRFNS